MHNDIYPSIHAADMGPVIGTFNGEPVRSYNPIDTEVRDARMTRMRVLISSGAGIPAEVLPGEIICKDNIIRRTTAAAEREVVGTEESLTSTGSTVKRVTLDEAKQLSDEGACIVWRPEGCAPGVEQYALVVE